MPVSVSSGGKTRVPEVIHPRSLTLNRYFYVVVVAAVHISIPVVENGHEELNVENLNLR